jgi:4a-hydroxytetrahydrobiopterin dehydratase
VKRTALPEGAVHEALAGLSGWTLAEDGRSIARDFAFASFSEAFAFMTRAALLAEKMDHHPDWSNSYRRVSVRLTTHVAQGLTELDFSFARELDRLA